MVFIIIVDVVHVLEEKKINRNFRNNVAVLYSTILTGTNLFSWYWELDRDDMYCSVLGLFRTLSIFLLE